MTQFDAYLIYCEHQRQRGLPAPSREWWDRCKRPVQPQRREDTQVDHEIEQREGWANG